MPEVVSTAGQKLISPTPIWWYIESLTASWRTWVGWKIQNNQIQSDEKPCTEQSQRWSSSTVLSETSKLEQEDWSSAGMYCPFSTSIQTAHFVWKIDIVDNIIKQASSINSVSSVHLSPNTGTNPLIRTNRLFLIWRSFSVAEWVSCTVCFLLAHITGERASFWIVTEIVSHFAELRLFAESRWAEDWCRFSYLIWQNPSTSEHPLYLYVHRLSSPCLAFKIKFVINLLLSLWS